MSSMVLYEDEDFSVTGQVVDDFFYVHVTARYYSRSIKGRMLSVWEDIKREVWLNGWDRIFSYNTNEKFAKMFCGHLVDKNIRMYVWELK